MDSTAPADLLDRYRRLQAYVGWTDEDARRVHDAAGRARHAFPVLVRDFYAAIFRHPEAAKVITGGERQVARLTGSLERWLDEAFRGPWDEAYVVRRWNVGRRHVEIGLDPTLVHAALARLRAGLTSALAPPDRAAGPEDAALVRSVDRLLDLDLALIQEAYQAELESLRRPVDEARLRQQRALATVSAAALEGTPFTALADLAVALLGDGLQADRADLFECDRDGRLVLRSGYGWPADDVGRLTADGAPGGQFAFVLATREAVVADLRAERRFIPAGQLAAAGLATSIQVVVAGVRGPCGTLGAHFAVPRAADPTDLDFVRSAANLLSAALHREAMEHRRRSSEDQLRQLVERLPAAAMHFVAGRLFVNSAAGAVTGLDPSRPAAAEDWDRLLVEWVADAATTAGPVAVRHARIRRSDGGERLVEVSSFRSDEDDVWVLKDITAEEESRRKTLQAERLAAIGQTITGLAHESRNALQRIRSCAGMLEFEVERNPEAMDLLRRLGRAQDDLERLFEEVRGYAAPIVLERTECVPAALCREAWELLDAARRDRPSSLEVTGPACDRAVRWDRFRMVQLFRILFENSLAAGGVTIVVECRDSDRAGVPSVELIVRDDGTGLSPEAARRVFEPFYTTKTRGTGLGTAIARRIAEAHGGVLELAPPSRTGAEFAIVLPRGDL